MSDAPYDLPDGWTAGRLGDLIYIAARIGWRGLKAEEYTQEGPLFLSVHNLNRGEHVDFSGAFHISELRYDESPEIQLRENDILLVKDGAGIGKIGIVKGLEEKATVNSSLLVIRVGDIFVPEFLFYFLKGPVMQDVVKQKITGSATPHVFQRDIKKFELLIPPLPEQRRIVARIERLFAESRTARDALERVPALLKRFRQSVLAAAFRGQLTERDPNDEPASAVLERIRAQRTQRLPKSSRLRKSETRKSETRKSEMTPTPPSPDTSNLPELPEGWVWASVFEIGTNVVDAVLTGPFGAQLPTSEFIDRGVPVVSIGNVGWGHLVTEKMDYVSRRKAEELERYRLRVGDVLFTRSGTVGRSAVVPSMADGWLMSSHLLRVRVEPSICVPDFLYLVFRGQLQILEQIADLARGATRPGFNKTLLGTLPIPLAPLAEQRRIVARVEALFAQADAVERAVAIARRRADKIDQAILARAFRGEL